MAPSLAKEGALRIFINLKSPSPSAGFEPANLVANGKHFADDDIYLHSVVLEHGDSFALTSVTDLLAVCYNTLPKICGSVISTNRIASDRKPECTPPGPEVLRCQPVIERGYRHGNGSNSLGHCLMDESFVQNGTEDKGVRVMLLLGCCPLSVGLRHFRLTLLNCKHRSFAANYF
jgi:hypothetical protein